MTKILISLLLFICYNCLSAIIRVPQDFPTIQQAIDNANWGDTVFVSPGTYSENGSIVVKSGIILKGSGKDITFIDGTGKNVVIYIPSGTTNFELSNFTIFGSLGNVIWFENGVNPNDLSVKIHNNRFQNCQKGIGIQNASVQVYDNEFYEIGGTTIGCSNNCNSLIFNNVINNSYGLGLAGISALNGSNPEIHHNIIDGGKTGITVMYNSNPTIFRNTITNCSESGIYVRASSPLIKKNTCNSNNFDGIEVDNHESKSQNYVRIIKNTCNNNNGFGIMVRDGMGCLIKRNTTVGNEGDGIGVMNLDENQNNFIINNIVLSNGFGSNPYSGGILAEYSKIYIINNLIVSNKRFGIYIYYCSPYVEIRHNTIDQIEDGAGVEIWGSPLVYLNHNIITNVSRSGVSAYSNSNVNVSYNDIFNYGTNRYYYESSSSINIGNGELESDPLFIADYYLSEPATGEPTQSERSPCIDSGGGSVNNYGLQGSTTRTDLVYDTGIVDIGYHHPLIGPVQYPITAIPTPTPTITPTPNPVPTLKVWFIFVLLIIISIVLRRSENV